MAKQTDQDLNLEQLLTRCKELQPSNRIRIYFDPDDFLFDIIFNGTMDFFLPPGSSFIGECRADEARFCIELFIGNAVRIITKLGE